jgi:hypothetical protein
MKVINEDTMMFTMDMTGVTGFEKIADATTQMTQGGSI